MEILLTFLAEVDCAFNERPKYMLEQEIDDTTLERTSSLTDIPNLNVPSIIAVPSIPETAAAGAFPTTVGDPPMMSGSVGPASGLDVSSHANQHLRSRSIDVNMHSSRKARAGSDYGKRKDRR